MPVQQVGIQARTGTVELVVQGFFQAFDEKYGHLRPGDIVFGAVVVGVASGSNTQIGEFLDITAGPVAGGYVVKQTARADIGCRFDKSGVAGWNGLFCLCNTRDPGADQSQGNPYFSYVVSSYLHCDYLAIHDVLFAGFFRLKTLLHPVEPKGSTDIRGQMTLG